MVVYISKNDDETIYDEEYFNNLIETLADKAIKNAREELAERSNR